MSLRSIGLKYWAVFSMNLQHQLERRLSLAMERLRSLALVLSLYYLWSALLDDPSRQFLGYSREQMLTYVLGLALLRSLVLTNRAFDLTWEIARGRLSFLMLRPISVYGHQFALDASDKMTRLASAIVEVALLVLLLEARLSAPRHPIAIVWAAMAATLALLLFFFISMALATSGFWSAESVGFLWAASLVMEFCSGAFFPLDVLPDLGRRVLMLSPFPYLVYFPLNLYLERLTAGEMIQGFIILAFWLLAIGLISRRLWDIGLRDYDAEGA
ncbi:MAG: ABC-2 family transporter protein [Elusimicrobia bacterium]|nr:ABC-2 family transporter protein [Elusimicrobiota bacterium]